MKHIITAILIFSACIAQGQFAVTKVTQPIDIGKQTLGCDTLDGVLICKYATFEGLILNYRTESVSTQWKIMFKTQGTEKTLPIKPLVVELQTSSSQYNDSATGNPLGSQDAMLALYGIKETITVDGQQVEQWKRNAQGQLLTTQKIYDGFSYYMQAVFDSNVRLKQVLRQTFIKPANLAFVQQRIKEHLAAQGL